MAAEVVAREVARASTIAATPVDQAQARLRQRIRTLACSGRHLPLPGHGHTIDRWRQLATVAAEDLSLVKLYEGHEDAIAIMAELSPAFAPPAGVWGTWAADALNRRLSMDATSDTMVSLHGTKYWCSGATMCDYALVTCWKEGQGPYLAAVGLRQAGVTIGMDGWNAVGMQATESLPVHFQGASALLIGRTAAYLRRPGFWQGGAGIAACWYGGATALAGELRAHLGAAPDVLKLAHLGAVDRSLHAAMVSLRHGATWIDSNPDDDASAVALRVRAIVEASSLSVLDHAGRALGASAYCLNERFARMAADLPVFLRQSHAERDLAALGERMLAAAGTPWAL